jgi:hypothetical protein
MRGRRGNFFKVKKREEGRGEMALGRTNEMDENRMWNERRRKSEQQKE